MLIDFQLVFLETAKITDLLDCIQNFNQGFEIRGNPLVRTLVNALVD